MFAIVDCNNFYASCERLFNPSLRREYICLDELGEKFRFGWSFQGNLALHCLSSHLSHLGRPVSLASHIFARYDGEGLKKSEQ